MGQHISRVTCGGGEVPMEDAGGKGVSHVLPDLATEEEGPDCNLITSVRTGTTWFLLGCEHEKNWKF